MLFAGGPSEAELPECALPLERGEEGGEDVLALALALGKSRVRNMLLRVWVQMLLLGWPAGGGGVAGISQDTSGEKPSWSGLWAATPTPRAEPCPPSPPPS